MASGKARVGIVHLRQRRFGHGEVVDEALDDRPRLLIGERLGRGIVRHGHAEERHGEDVRRRLQPMAVERLAETFGCLHELHAAQGEAGRVVIGRLPQMGIQRRCRIGQAAGLQKGPRLFNCRYLGGAQGSRRQDQRQHRREHQDPSGRHGLVPSS